MSDAAEYLRAIVAAKREDWSTIADQLKVTPGELLDFRLGIKEFSPEQLDKLAKILFYGACSIKDGKLCLFRSYGPPDQLNAGSIAASGTA